MNEKMMEDLCLVLNRLHERHEKFNTIPPDYFEPGEMEFLDKVEGIFDKDNSCALVRFEAKGTRYDGRTELIEKVSEGDLVQIVRDEQNAFNSNNFALLTEKGKDLGNMPAELCNAIAPLYDLGVLQFEDTHVSYVEHLSKRSRYAKQAMLFVETKLRISKE